MFIGFCSLLLLSEIFYIAKNPEELYGYILNASKSVAKMGAVDASFYILTSGKIGLPNDSDFKSRVKDYLNTSSSKNDLSKIYYDLAIMAYNNGQGYLTRDLLKLSIDNRPDLSFYYVEFANYLLLKRRVDEGREILDECIKRPYPQKHCQAYLNDNFGNAQPEKIGFLREYVESFYK